MDSIQIRIKTLPGATVPEYKSAGAAGADLFSLLDAPIILKPGETSLIPTGIFLEIPEGFEAQVRPRSGLAAQYGITLLNAPGTIDSDYRGEVKVILTNLGMENFTVTNGMRIAQIVFSRFERGSFFESDILTETKRNEGGFGHTGL